MTETLPYGAWPSPISARDVAAGAHPVEGGRYVGDEIWWLERMPSERGRSAVRRAAASGAEPETLLPAPWDVRSRVHEYGGGAWTVADGVLYFVESSDQRLWTMVPGGAPRPLTPAEGGMRFADLVMWGDRVLAVRETDIEGRMPQRDIVTVPVDGSAAEDAAAIVSVVAGSDFVAYPRVSPDGARLAWIAWNHPNMPWEATKLRVGELVDGRVAGWTTEVGNPGEAPQSVLQPEWVPGVRRYATPEVTPGPELLYVTDSGGRWNLHRVGFDGMSSPEAIAPVDADTGGGLWNLGIRWYVPLPGGRIVSVRTNGSDSLWLQQPDGSAREIPSPVTARVLFTDVRGSRVLFAGAGATTLGGLWELDLDATDPAPRLVRSAVDESPAPAWLPVAQSITVDGQHGAVHAFAYPPTNPDVTGPADAAPPYLVLVHGGPTAHRAGEASVDIAYFTSRGIGVLDVNYGGSTGYGREYRERLNGQWGIVDRDDVIAAASGLADAGLADGARLAIRGGSAGGWTVLCALTASDRFAAGISRYGVADLRALAADTHDFEARYLDGLVGPLPEAEAVYLDRSPLSHLDRFTTPMLIEQGLDDPVVPPAQSEAVRDALASRGIPHAYLAFAGESHGFRRPETVIAALEAELSFLGQVLGFEPLDVPRLALD
ncbi:peptidase S9 [Microbacterium sp. Root61]|uniref:dipeptidyl-peptidase 5 n=1 Tax=Microbacterium sp. Root61 TaxID=1736570 RepID=UPI0006F6E92C|nr:prolyl oligopeptidase family serine peptidase [Microbacterium sp. Root61]KRA22456.1 peptidase S9 [Microbacterium sp. Root61]